MNIKKNENGDRIISRSEGSPEIRDVIFPLAAVVGTKYLDTDRLGQVMVAVRDYYLYAHVRSHRRSDRGCCTASSGDLEGQECFGQNAS